MPTIPFPHAKLIPAVNALAAIVEKNCKPGRLNMKLGQILDGLFPHAKRIEANLAAQRADGAPTSAIMELVSGTTEIVLPYLTDDDLERLERDYIGDAAIDMRALSPLFAALETTAEHAPDAKGLHVA